MDKGRHDRRERCSHHNTDCQIDYISPIQNDKCICLPSAISVITEIAQRYLFKNSLKLSSTPPTALTPLPTPDVTPEAIFWTLFLLLGSSSIPDISTLTVQWSMEGYPQVSPDFIFLAGNPGLPVCGKNELCPWPPSFVRRQKCRMATPDQSVTPVSQNAV